MPRLLCLAVLLIVPAVFSADQLAEKWQKRIDSVESAYAAAVKKADDARFFAIQKANADRLKVLKTAMSDATKAGDFPAASAIKDKVDAAERDGVTRPKPKNVVKFGGHEYALIEDKVTWHTAKRRCEEMGGSLAIINTPQESEAIAALCGKTDAWAGASDEDTEGKWLWVDGSPVPDSIKALIRTTDETGEQHNLLWFPKDNQWAAGRGGARVAYVCEWGN